MRHTLAPTSGPSRQPGAARWSKALAVRECQHCMTVHAIEVGDQRWLRLDGVKPDALPDLSAHGINEDMLSDLTDDRRGVGLHAVGTAFVITLMCLDLNHGRVEEMPLRLLISEEILVSWSPRRIKEMDDVARLCQEGAVTTLLRALLEILDRIVDSYFPVIDQLNQSVWHLETTILFGSKPGILDTILHLRRQILTLRKHFATERDTLHRAARRLPLPMHAKERDLLDDIYDHLLLACEMIDTCRDLVGSSLEGYMSTVSNRLNETMKTLTIIATILMPMTVITGIYGMNFKMREFTWPYGHVFAYALMVVSTLAMLIYFRRRHWL